MLEKIREVGDIYKKKEKKKERGRKEEGKAFIPLNSKFYVLYFTLLPLPEAL
ncbi:hypothetical protein [Methanosarcina sp. MTP4]|uniref:hypothetical protein n=1 Tax=Methanosarcina sp. MTP4 TaxID=1434100 RepID=UPI0012DFEAB5|nr:hypothetical protein [Methanosarcina sp. MTP4]